MPWQPIFTALIIIAIIVSLVREKGRPDFNLLLGLGVFLIVGIVTPNEAFSGFSHPATLTVGFLFILAGAIQKTGGHLLLGKLTGSNGKGGYRSDLARIMGPTSVMSAFMNNTPIVAMFIPYLQQLSKKTGIPVSKYMIPLSYAAIIGGTITIIGTSTNLIVSGMLEERGGTAIGFFELAKIGVPATILVILYFILIGHKLLPDRSVHSDDHPDSMTGSEYHFELQVPPGSPYAGKTIESSGLRHLKKAYLTYIRRDGQIYGPASPDDLIREGDVLTFTGDIVMHDELLLRSGLSRKAPGIDGYEQGRTLPLFEAVLAPSSSLCGTTLKKAGFRENYQGVVLAIHRRGEHIKGGIGNIPLKAGDLLVIEAPEGFDKRWSARKDEYYLVAPVNRELPVHDKKKKLQALIIFGAVILTAATGLLPIVISAFAGVILTVLTGVMTKTEVRAAINFPVLLVIAAAIGISKAVDNSGLAENMASVLIGITEYAGPVGLILGIYLMTNILTELISNNGAAAMMVPVALSIALATGLDQHAAAITVAIAASASFVSPIGYQTNLMIMAPGNYKFTDFFKAGLPVSIIVMGVAVGVVAFAV